MNAIAYRLDVQEDGTKVKIADVPGPVQDAIWATDKGTDQTPGTVITGATSHGGKEYRWAFTIGTVQPGDIPESKSGVLPDWMRIQTGS